MFPYTDDPHPSKPTTQELFSFWLTNPDAETLIHIHGGLEKLKKHHDESAAPIRRTIPNGVDGKEVLEPAPCSADGFMDMELGARTKYFDVKLPALRSTWSGYTELKQRGHFPEDDVTPIITTSRPSHDYTLEHGMEMISKAFSAEGLDDNLAGNLVGLDLVYDTEMARRKELCSLADRLGLTAENWHEVLKQTPWGFTQIEILVHENHQCEVFYASLFLDLRVTIFLSYLITPDTQVASIIALLNTLFPMTVREIPNYEMHASELYYWRSALYECILIKTQLGSEGLEQVVLPIHWESIKENLTHYIQLSSKMVSDAKKFPSIKFFMDIDLVPASDTGASDGGLSVARYLPSEGDDTPIPSSSTLGKNIRTVASMLFKRSSADLPLPEGQLSEDEKAMMLPPPSLDLTSINVARVGRAPTASKIVKEWDKGLDEQQAIAPSSRRDSKAKKAEGQVKKSGDKGNKVKRASAESAPPFPTQRDSYRHSHHNLLGELEEFPQVSKSKPPLSSLALRERINSRSPLTSPDLLSGRAATFSSTNNPTAKPLNMGSALSTMRSVLSVRNPDPPSPGSNKSRLGQHNSDGDSAEMEEDSGLDSGSSNETVRPGAPGDLESERDSLNEGDSRSNDGNTGSTPMGQGSTQRDSLGITGGVDSRVANPQHHLPIPPRGPPRQITTEEFLAEQLAYIEAEPDYIPPSKKKSLVDPNKTPGLKEALDSYAYEPTFTPPSTAKAHTIESRSRFTVNENIQFGNATGRFGEVADPGMAEVQLPVVPRPGYKLRARPATGPVANRLRMEEEWVVDENFVPPTPTTPLPPPSPPSAGPSRAFVSSEKTGGPEAKKKNKNKKKKKKAKPAPAFSAGRSPPPSGFALPSGSRQLFRWGTGPDGGPVPGPGLAPPSGGAAADTEPFPEF